MMDTPYTLPRQFLFDLLLFEQKKKNKRLTSLFIKRLLKGIPLSLMEKKKKEIFIFY